MQHSFLEIVVIVAAAFAGIALVIGMVVYNIPGLKKFLPRWLQ